LLPFDWMADSVGWLIQSAILRQAIIRLHIAGTAAVRSGECELSRPLAVLRAARVADRSAAEAGPCAIESRGTSY
jgi:hypothetical protein